LTYILYAFQVLIVSKSVFKFEIDKGLLYTLSVNLVLTTLSILFVLLIKNNFLMYTSSVIIIIGSFVYNLYIFDKRLGLKLRFFS